MNSNRVQGRGLRSSVWLPLVLNLLVVIQITQYLFVVLSGSVILAVYVDDILLTKSDSVALAETKEYLKRHFVTKDMGKPRYFLGIEVYYKKHGLLLSQRKYTLDLLEETGMVGCKPASTLMEANVNLWCDISHLLDDPGQYRRLIGKLI